MKIVVCIKQVPDSAAKITVEGGQVTWGDAPSIINPWDEYAVESALQQAEALGGEVTAITIGDESTDDTLKYALAMGCNDAVRITDPALVGADSQAIARVLAAVIRKIGEVEIAFFGRQAIDNDLGVTAAQTARVLGWPALTLTAVVQSVQGGVVRVERSNEEGRQILEAKMPVVISVGKDIGEPRLRSFMGIRKASRAVIPVWSLADLGMISPAFLVKWFDLMNAPTREVTTEMITGGSAQEIAEKLVDKILAEKVL